MGLALQQEPENPTVYNNLGEAYRALNRMDEAVRCYRKAISLIPGYAIAHNNLGIALFDQGRLDDAIDSFQKALSLKPDLAGVSGNLCKALGKAYLQRGHHAKGLELTLMNTGFIRFNSKSEIKLIQGIMNATS
jgi:tetratricopeptide (TPR) repeat protein